jgi:hypothetical protein
VTVSVGPTRTAGPGDTQLGLGLDPGAGGPIIGSGSRAESEPEGPPSQSSRSESESRRDAGPESAAARAAGHCRSHGRGPVTVTSLAPCGGSCQ